MCRKVACRVIFQLILLWRDIRRQNRFNPEYALCKFWLFQNVDPNYCQFCRIMSRIDQLHAQAKILHKFLWIAGVRHNTAFHIQSPEQLVDGHEKPDKSKYCDIFNRQQIGSEQYTWGDIRRGERICRRTWSNVCWNECNDVSGSDIFKQFTRIRSVCIKIIAHFEIHDFICTHSILSLSFSRGAKVEDAFLETARKIYQNIQDGRLDLNASESGVQHKPSQPGRTSLTNDTAANKDNCSC